VLLYVQHIRIQLNFKAEFEISVLVNFITLFPSYEAASCIIQLLLTPHPVGGRISTEKWSYPTATVTTKRINMHKPIGGK
jgi:hypothetical protein